MDKKESQLTKAKIAEQIERYDDMSSEMKAMVQDNNRALTDEERNLLSVAYKNIVGTKRSAWRVVASLEQKAKDKNDDAKKIAISKQYRERIENELNVICDEVIQLLDDKLIPNAEGDESTVFYQKMKGDYFRYKVEVAQETRPELSKKSEDAYTAAWNIANKEDGKMEPTNPIRLGLALNYSVFHYEIMNNPEKACELAKGAFDKAIEKIENPSSEDTLKDSMLIMQLLRDNLTLWTSEINDDEGQEEQTQQD